MFWKDREGMKRNEIDEVAQKAALKQRGEGFRRSRSIFP